MFYITLKLFLIKLIHKKLKIIKTLVPTVHYCVIVCSKILLFFGNKKSKWMNEWLSSQYLPGFTKKEKNNNPLLYSKCTGGHFTFTSVYPVRYLKRDTPVELHHKYLKLKQSNIPHTTMCILVFPKGYTTSQVVFLGQLQIITWWELVHSIKSRIWLVCCLQCVFWSAKYFVLDQL